MTSPFDAYRMDGRVAVVTGAASGIGAATCEVLAAAGASVVCADLNADGLASTVAAVEAAGTRAHAVPTDVTKRAQVEAMIDAAVGEFGRIDAVCNIAGAMFPGLIEDLDDDTIDRGIDLNLKGVLYGTQYAIKAMKGQGSGAIVNVSSGAIDLPYAGIGVYAFTKAAVAMLSMTAALEAGEHGIRVNAIAPGMTVTPFTTWRLHKPDGTIDQQAYDEFMEYSKSMSPLGIVGESMDQALLIQYLVSDASKYATGQIFRVNGGQTWAW
ncbi:MAG: SDR family NAD(P)-dependent oxidoreductase [Acidimicrobiia bacterium]|jgi:3-oxoacyl-[acyl-carrier protein] reductase